VPEVSEVSPETIRVRVDWSEAEASRPQHVNQALSSIGPPGSDGIPDGVYLTLGTVFPPAITEDSDARNQLFERLRENGIKVNVAGSFHMTRQMVNDLIAVLQGTAAKYDAAIRQAQDPTADQGGKPT
jgi:hypothetical protein